jgi:hypothetical protein
MKAPSPKATSLIALAPDLTREFIEFNRKAHQLVVHGKPLLAKLPAGAAQAEEISALQRA